MGGWSPIADTWAYNSTDNPTGVINWTGANGKVSAGMRIRFNNGGNTIYGIVTAVTGSTMTFLHEMNEANNNAVNLMANSAITNPFVSAYKAPLGFNGNPDKWSVIREEIGTTRQQVSPSNDVWYNIGGINLVVPIGVWDLSYSTQVSASTSSPTPYMQLFTTLSTSSTSQSDVYFSSLSGSDHSSANTSRADRHEGRRIITRTTKATYYLLARVFSAGTISQLNINNTQGGLQIRATCSYL